MPKGGVASKHQGLNQILKQRIVALGSKASASFPVIGTRKSLRSSAGSGEKRPLGPLGTRPRRHAGVTSGGGARQNQETYRQDLSAAVRTGSSDGRLERARAGVLATPGTVRMPRSPVRTPRGAVRTFPRSGFRRARDPAVGFLAARIWAWWGPRGNRFTVFPRRWSPPSSGRVAATAPPGQ